MKDVPLINFGYLQNSQLLSSFLFYGYKCSFKLYYSVFVLLVFYANHVVNVQVKK